MIGGSQNGSLQSRSQVRKLVSAGTMRKLKVMYNSNIRGLNIRGLKMGDEQVEVLVNVIFLGSGEMLIRNAKMIPEGGCC